MLGGAPADRIVALSANDARSVAAELVPAVLAVAPELRLALGRRLPPFRDAAARQTIAEAARVNAEIALVSSLPASIPLVNLAVAGADTLVLTKNQVMLLVKLAAISGRQLRSPVRLLTEIAPVVGASFLWRTIARAGAGLLPGYIAAVPKAIVAYTGTYVVGAAAHYYYRHGLRPAGATIEGYAREATAQAHAWIEQTLPRLTSAPGRVGSGLLERLRRLSPSGSRDYVTLPLPAAPAEPNVEAAPGPTESTPTESGQSG
jgi:hypothetical protein